MGLYVSPFCDYPLIPRVLFRYAIIIRIVGPQPSCRWHACHFLVSCGIFLFAFTLKIIWDTYGQRDANTEACWCFKLTVTVTDTNYYYYRFGLEHRFPRHPTSSPKVSDITCGLPVNGDVKFNMEFAWGKRFSLLISQTLFSVYFTIFYELGTNFWK